MSADLMSLHIGDRILEVNGSPIGNQPIQEIENLIRCSDQSLQVTFILDHTRFRLLLKRVDFLL